jgi:hypothetical protein
MTLNNREFLICIERERGWAGQQAGIFKVKLGLGEREIKSKTDKEREREIERNRNRADNKNPEQLPGRDQLVFNK